MLVVQKTRLVRFMRLGIGVLMCALAGVYAVHYAGAIGIPTSNTLTYTGTLLTFGQPDNATHSVSAQILVAGAQQCFAPAASVTCVNGQFSIPLPAACTSVIQTYPNAQVEVTIDGTLMGPTSLSAVPYAVTAGTVDLGGVTGVLPIANGGTASTTQNFVDLSSTQTVGGAKTFTNKVTANAIVQSTSGGIEFPDNSIQTTAADLGIQRGSVSNVASFTISGLNGDVDMTYQLDIWGTVTTNADLQILMTPNGLTGATYYSHQWREDDVPNNIVELGAALQGIWIGRSVYATNGAISISTRFHAQSGQLRQATSQCEFYASQSGGGLASLGGTWDDSTTVVSSLTFYVYHYGTTTPGAFTGHWRIQPRP